MPTNVERFLEASKGEPLLYFDSYEALKFFFVQSLKWEDEEDSLLPDLKEFGNFVVFANPKGLLIGPDVAEYFADKRNPLYNAELAEEEAYELFCEEGLCPFDLLKYEWNMICCRKHSSRLRTERSCCGKTGILWLAGFWVSITKENRNYKK